MSNLEKFKQFTSLPIGFIVYDRLGKRWKINGKLQGSLKTGSCKIPIKHGLHSYDYITLQNVDVASMTKPK